MPTTEKHLERIAKAIYEQTALTTQRWDAQPESVKNTYREDAYAAQAASLTEAQESKELWKEEWRSASERASKAEARLALVEPLAAKLADALQYVMRMRRVQCEHPNRPIENYHDGDLVCAKHRGDEALAAYDALPQAAPAQPVEDR